MDGGRIGAGVEGAVEIPRAPHDAAEAVPRLALHDKKRFARMGSDFIEEGNRFRAVEKHSAHDLAEDALRDASDTCVVEEGHAVGVRRAEEVLRKPANETALGESGRGFDHFQATMDSSRLVLPSATGCEELLQREGARADFLVIPAEAANFGERAEKRGGKDAACAKTGAFRRGGEEGDF